MKIKLLLIILTIVLIYSSCKDKKNKTLTLDDSTKPKIALAKVPNSWVEKRVKKTKEKLNATEAGKIIWQAMQAHGGLEKWHKNGPISFRFNYQPIDGSTKRDTYQVIDTWRSHARHYQVGDSTAQYGWNGKNAWLMAKDSLTFTYNTRFWSLTPYFFSGLPFLLDGNGVNLELLPQKEFNKRLNDVIKVTFADGTGDAPDDYYVLYFDNETHKMSVIRYIVSYPGYFKKGGNSPEKLMELFGEQTIEGISFPQSYKTHWLTKDETAGEHITNITLSNIEFKQNLKASHFYIPEGAKIIKDL